MTQIIYFYTDISLGCGSALLADEFVEHEKHEEDPSGWNRS